MEKKEAYQDKMNARFAEWQAKIDMLKVKADQAEAQQKLRYYAEIESLRAKQEQVREKLDELGSAGESAWEELRSGVELAWQALQDALEEAVKKFK